MLVPRLFLPSPLPSWVLALLLSGGAGIAPAALDAQGPPSASDPDGWNAPFVLDLVERGRSARHQLITDGGLERYEARIDGHIYFYLDPESAAPLLIRVDQVAVELRWEAPDRLQQRIVGERSETRLPVQDFRYYADRLTLVEYGFGDEIRVGLGRDVAGVPHPLAATPDGSPETSPYDFRLSASLSLSLPGRDDPLRVHEIEIRPRDPTRPGMIGTISLEGETGSLVRIAAAFTPASYVDRRSDRISVALDYGLWEGRYWLPNEQVIEVRREIPEVDIGVGTVIRSVLRTGSYRLNLPLSEEIRFLPPVTALPPEERRRFPFSEGLYDGIDRDGIGGVRTEVDLRTLRAEAVELATARAPSGLSPLRLHIPNISSLVRYSRAEGLRIGSGLTLRPNPFLRIRGMLGLAVGAERLDGSLALEAIPAPRWTLAAETHLSAARDLGLAAGIDPLLSSLRTATRGEDYLDPYLASGGRLTLTFAVDPATSLSIGAGFDRIRSAEATREEAPVGEGHRYRPIRPVTEGEYLTTSLRLGRALFLPGGGTGWSRVGVSFHSGPPGSGTAWEGEGEVRWGPPAGARDATLAIRGWHWVGDPLFQGYRLFGGRGTLPGYPYRRFVGETVAVGSLVGAVDLGSPLLRLRTGLHAGWGQGAPSQVESVWGADGTEGIRGAASIGLGIGWDVLRIDLARGFSGGEWQLLLSIDPRWWDRL